MTERRYSDAEIADIFSQAADSTHLPAAQRAVADGLTLVELQDIGREAGIPADRVALAASHLDSHPVAQTSTLVGLPIGVRHSTELSRRLTDSEWDQMVVAARSTFAAMGRQSATGEFREWTNGNLAMMLEPTATGHRIRMQTRNANAQAMVTAGFSMTAFGTAFAASSMFAMELKAAKLLSVGAVIIGMGLLLAAVATVRLPGWARRRREQMLRLGTMAQHMANTPANPPTLGP